MFTGFRIVVTARTSELFWLGSVRKMSGCSSRMKSVRHSGNNRAYNVQVKGWPSAEHKCVIVIHNDDVLTVNCLRNHVKGYGTIIKSRTLPMSLKVMSTFEMSTASEAELAWKGILKQKLKGLSKVFPDQEHQTIDTYTPYWCTDVVEEGLKNGSLISGCIRLNPRMYHIGFISDDDKPDILIDSILARNRALSGDLVAVKVRDPIHWKSESDLYGEKGVDSPDMCEQSDRQIKTADVVQILQKRHNRNCVGVLVERRKDSVLFRPVDNCLPRLLIPVVQCPTEFIKNPQDYQNKLFLSSITSWSEDEIFPQGCLKKYIGNKGEIEVETERILLENDVDDSEFVPGVEETIIQEFCSIPREEYSNRRDLRSECVFTIDPSTAKDLDDALHCKKVSENEYEVGVHIADVSFYVQPNTEVDTIAARRCTSVYLVQRVMPMLPKALCEKLCSLNPGQDKLTYSVIWKITGEGKVLETWYGRTIIRSCAKLTYDNAQSFINEPGAELDVGCYPSVDGGHQLTTVRNKVLEMHNIAQFLKKERCQNGALRLDQIKLAFTLDEDTGMPNSCFTYKRQASNELVEEFMLLANMSVARKLNENLPDLAFLRRHPAPKPDMLRKVAGYCSTHGWKLDVTSSGNLSKSLEMAEKSGKMPENSIHGLLHFTTKPQELALYFCTGCMDNEESYRHYALNVPLYTHFTSPIRRYADIITHRQLASIQDDCYSDTMNRLTTEDLQKQANLCNIRKAQSKKVQELSVQLFFYAMIKTVGALEDKALVLQVYEHCFDVLPLNNGQVSRIYVDNLALIGSKYLKHSSSLEFIWPCNGDDKYKLTDEEIKLAKIGKLQMAHYSSTLTETIEVFSTVNIIFEASENEFKIRTYLKKPCMG